MSSGPFTLTLPAPDPALPTASLIAESAQVRELFHLRWIDADSKVEQRSSLRKDAGRHHVRRDVLTDPAERAKKLAIETGYDIRRDLFLKAPLEPWLCDYPAIAMRAYADIMNEVPGADVIANWNDKARLDALLYLRSEQLVMVSEDRLRVVPLSDARPAERRKYPGAPVDDDHAKIGKYLGGILDDLIIEAHRNLSTGQSAQRRPRRLRPGALLSAGIRLTAHEICEEVNAIKARRRDLDSFRWAGTDITRKRIKSLIDERKLIELEPPHAVREGRSWKTIGRVFERAPAGPKPARTTPRHAPRVYHERSSRGPSIMRSP